MFSPLVAFDLVKFLVWCMRCGTRFSIGIRKKRRLDYSLQRKWLVSY